MAAFSLRGAGAATRLLQPRQDFGHAICCPSATPDAAGTHIPDTMVQRENRCVYFAPFSRHTRRVVEGNDLGQRHRGAVAARGNAVARVAILRL
jgi:hypothetical protein